MANKEIKRGWFSKVSFGQDKSDEGYCFDGEGTPGANGAWNKFKHALAHYGPDHDLTVKNAQAFEGMTGEDPFELINQLNELNYPGREIDYRKPRDEW